MSASKEELLTPPFHLQLQEYEIGNYVTTATYIVNSDTKLLYVTLTVLRIGRYNLAGILLVKTKLRGGGVLHFNSISRSNLNQRKVPSKQKRTRFGIAKMA